MTTPLTPATLAFAADGAPRSAAYDDIYHSADGGPGQARQVFLRGNGLPERWRQRDRFVILETGFGSGLNFLASWAAWRDDPARPARLHYLAVENHPLGVADLAALHRRWPEFEFLASALREAWPLPLPGFHRLEFAGGRVTLTLLLGEAEAVLRQARARVDAFYFDGFDPRKNPRMWSPALFRQCARLAASDATLATWCVAGPVRAALAEAGFDTARRDGYGRKRHMLAGRLASRADGAPGDAGVNRRERHAVVLGAGLAGCAVAERLAARGWSVDILDRHAAPAGGASGNLAGIVRPIMSRDDNLASRLSRACFLYALRAWNRLDRLGHPPRRGLDGVLQLARDAAHEARQREVLAPGHYPADYARFVEIDVAGDLLGTPTAAGGWWFAGGGWASPADLCRAWLAAAGLTTRFRGGVEVTSLQAAGSTWRLLDGAGKVLAEAPLLVLASGADAARLAQTARLPLERARGQVSHVPAGRLPTLRHALCREGYLTPALDGVHCLGATYGHDADDGLRADEHADNLRRLATMLPGAEQGLDAHALDGRVGFRATTPDRLPLVGALPDPLATPDARDDLDHLPRLPGAHGLLGLGSRGLVWAALAAEHLASLIEDEPLPLERDLAAAIDPGRFALRAARHARG